MFACFDVATRVFKTTVCSKNEMSGNFVPPASDSDDDCICLGSLSPVPTQQQELQLPVKNEEIPAEEQEEEIPAEEQEEEIPETQEEIPETQEEIPETQQDEVLPDPLHKQQKQLQGIFSLCTQMHKAADNAPPVAVPLEAKKPKFTIPLQDLFRARGSACGMPAPIFKDLWPHVTAFQSKLQASKLLKHFDAWCEHMQDCQHGKTTRKDRATKQYKAEGGHFGVEETTDVKMEPVDVLGRPLTLCSSGTACRGLLRPLTYGCMPYSVPGKDRCVECINNEPATAVVSVQAIANAVQAALDPDALKEQMARRKELQHGNYQRKDAERQKKAEEAKAQREERAALLAERNQLTPEQQAAQAQAEEEANAKKKAASEKRAETLALEKQKAEAAQKALEQEKAQAIASRVSEQVSEQVAQTMVTITEQFQGQQHAMQALLAKAAEDMKQMQEQATKMQEAMKKMRRSKKAQTQDSQESQESQNSQVSNASSTTRRRRKAKAAKGKRKTFSEGELRHAVKKHRHRRQGSDCEMDEEGDERETASHFIKGKDTKTAADASVEEAVRAADGTILQGGRIFMTDKGVVKARFGPKRKSMPDEEWKKLMDSDGSAKKRKNAVGGSSSKRDDGGPSVVIDMCSDDDASAPGAAAASTGAA